ncbi:MAG TPA: hypothetical protein VL201_05205 [Patescibacteria group bacterium]|nr:hypothetical protein [Patescibacteria group bacterium]
MGIFNNHRYYVLKILMVYVISFYPLKISSQLFSPCTFDTTALECYFCCAVNNCTTGNVPFPECNFAGLSGDLYKGFAIAGMSLGPVFLGFSAGYYVNFFYQRYIKKNTIVIKNISENSPLKEINNDYK